MCLKNDAASLSGLILTKNVSGGSITLCWTKSIRVLIYTMSFLVCVSRMMLLAYRPQRFMASGESMYFSKAKAILPRTAQEVVWAMDTTHCQRCLSVKKLTKRYPWHPEQTFYNEKLAQSFTFIKHSPCEIFNIRVLKTVGLVLKLYYCCRQ